MTRIVTLAALILLVAGPALADKPRHKPKAHAPAAHSSCPPGLAKKNPPCVPPGLAKQGAWQGYREGDRIRDGHVLLDDPTRYRLDPALTYWRVGENLYRVDPETGRVLAVLGLLSTLLN
ncbi:excinuclease ABC subunit A [Rhodobacter sp. Har01]|uniref:excinuclease ABC subunit A n=1 Tax=Rhodobacter sp. Har01 TaxID=2883999 RepID=UPI001D094328|nr:excinuclease ABC subunit A [Rhodobacter sp. Har01]MCB6177159.1 excinuclease ABC subunit A [Rhodobacter sp. Har01]